MALKSQVGKGVDEIELGNDLKVGVRLKAGTYCLYIGTNLEKPDFEP